MVLASYDGVEFWTSASMFAQLIATMMVLNGRGTVEVRAIEPPIKTS